MVFEDIHWIDPTTRELLDLTVDRVRLLPVPLAITFRPEFQPPWASRAHVTSLQDHERAKGIRRIRVGAGAGGR